MYTVQNMRLPKLLLCTAYQVNFITFQHSSLCVLCKKYTLRNFFFVYYMNRRIFHHHTSSCALKYVNLFKNIYCVEKITTNKPFSQMWHPENEEKKAKGKKFTEIYLFRNSNFFCFILCFLTHFYPMPRSFHTIKSRTITTHIIHTHIHTAWYFVCVCEDEYYEDFKMSRIDFNKKKLFMVLRLRKCRRKINCAFCVVACLYIVK